MALSLYAIGALPLLALFLFFTLARLPGLLATSWLTAADRGRQAGGAISAGSWLNAAGDAVSLLLLAISVVGVCFMLGSFGNATMRWLWHWSAPSWPRRAGAALASSTAAIMMLWLWMPWLPATVAAELGIAGTGREGARYAPAPAVAAASESTPSSIVSANGQAGSVEAGATFAGSGAGGPANPDPLWRIPVWQPGMGAGDWPGANDALPASRTSSVRPAVSAVPSAPPARSGTPAVASSAPAGGLVPGAPEAGSSPPSALPAASMSPTPNYGPSTGALAGASSIASSSPQPAVSNTPPSGPSSSPTASCALTPAPSGSPSPSASPSSGDLPSPSASPSSSRLPAASASAPQAASSSACSSPKPS